MTRGNGFLRDPGDACFFRPKRGAVEWCLPSPVYCTFKREAARCVQWIDNQLRAIDPQWWKRRGARPARTPPAPRLPITSGTSLVETPTAQISGA